MREIYVSWQEEAAYVHPLTPGDCRPAGKTQRLLGFPPLDVALRGVGSTRPPYLPTTNCYDYSTE